MCFVDSVIYKDVWGSINHLIEYYLITVSEFHPADITRIKENNNWLRRFLEHNENNAQETLNMLWETCIWRTKFGTNGKHNKHPYVSYIFTLFLYVIKYMYPIMKWYIM